jgi:hypothetical protein
LAARKNLPRWGSPQPRGTDGASALKCQAFGGEGANLIFCIHRSSFILPGTAGIFVSQRVILLSAFFLLHSTGGVGVQPGQGEKLVAGLFDAVFHAQPVEVCALGLLLAGSRFAFRRPPVTVPANASSNRAASCSSSRLIEIVRLQRPTILDGHPGRGGLARQGNLRRALCILHSAFRTESALSGQRFGGERAGGFDRLELLISQ